MRLVSTPAATKGLKDTRIDRLLTQKELADRAGISRATVQGIEAGRVVASPLTQERLALALGVPRRELFPEPEEAA